jgi:ERCC4-type nuclease
MTENNMPTILIDTREQRPYTFSAAIPTRRTRLFYGDYSLEGMVGRVAIERKSLGDWVSTITHSRARFTRELEKLSTFEWAYVVVEGNEDTIQAGRYERAATNTPAKLLPRMRGIFEKYPTITFLLCRDRIHARETVEGLLLEISRAAAREE